MITAICSHRAVYQFHFVICISRVRSWCFAEFGLFGPLEDVDTLRTAEAGRTGYIFHNASFNPTATNEASSSLYPIRWTDQVKVESVDEIQPALLPVIEERPQNEEEEESSTPTSCRSTSSFATVQNVALVADHP